MRQLHFWIALSTLPLALASARADDGAAGTGTLLAVHATGQASAPPTLLTAVFIAQASGPDASAAQAKVNTLSADASHMASSAPATKFLAQSYSVTQDGDAKPPTTRWTARQTLSISSTDSGALLQLTGKLQARGLALDDLRWSLDDKTRDALRDKAQEDALRRLQAQATLAARTLGMKFTRFKEVRLERPFTPGPMMSMARVSALAMPMKAAPAQRSEEDQDVTVSASGDAILSSP